MKGKKVVLWGLTVICIIVTAALCPRQCGLLGRAADWNALLSQQ